MIISVHAASQLQQEARVARFQQTRYLLVFLLISFGSLRAAARRRPPLRRHSCIDWRDNTIFAVQNAQLLLDIIPNACQNNLQVVGSRMRLLAILDVTMDHAPNEEKLFLLSSDLSGDSLIVFGESIFRHDQEKIKFRESDFFEIRLLETSAFRLQAGPKI